MSQLIGGGLSVVNSPGPTTFMSRGRGSYSRAGDPGNNLFFYRQQYAVFLTPPTPKNLTAILPTFPTAADTFTGSLAEVGTQGTESINGLERLIASLAESGTKGTDSINALERFISQLAETGQLGTDAINAAAGDFYSAVIVERATRHGGVKRQSDSRQLSPCPTPGDSRCPSSRFPNLSRGDSGDRITGK